ncbi:hypothetical protein NH286_05580 [Anaerococcus sp. NML200574]|nr:hypothetical protein [Anaerococcus sp. NML200574]MCW6678625.1 hypothetical protein [Anaerococcus sp. NML200574]
MKNINLYIPKERELDFAKNLLKDPATMAYKIGVAPFIFSNKIFIE